MGRFSLLRLVFQSTLKLGHEMQTLVRFRPTSTRCVSLAAWRLVTWMEHRRPFSHQPHRVEYSGFSQTLPRPVGAAGFEGKDLGTVVP